MLCLATVPPLTEDQQAELKGISDDSPQLIEPGLDVLLANVAQWDAADEAGARIPDYDSLLENPVAGRGVLFLLEGQFAGRARRIKLQDVDPRFGDALTEWVILVREEPEEVAVVYFLDSEGLMEAPQTGADVRVVGRFYKIWADMDQQGRPTRYLTFVARSAMVGRSSASNSGSTTMPMLIVIVILCVTFIILRYQVKRRTPNVPRGVMLSGPAGADPAAQDPAEALQQMAKQHNDKDRTGENHGDR